MYEYDWFTLRYSRNYHKILSQLYSNKGFIGGVSGKEIAC